MAQAPRAGGTWLRLVRETFVPVCAPELLARFAGNSMEQLFQQAPLVEVTSVLEDWDWRARLHFIDQPASEQPGFSAVERRLLADKPVGCRALPRRAADLHKAAGCNLVIDQRFAAKSDPQPLHGSVGGKLHRIDFDILVAARLLDIALLEPPTAR
jgi:hypothetical protein